MQDSATLVATAAVAFKDKRKINKSYKRHYITQE